MITSIARFPPVDMEAAWLANLADLNVCSQRGLIERFDSTIGAATILLPFGGRFQATPPEGMAAKLPVSTGETETATLMTYGANPYLRSGAPFMERSMPLRKRWRKLSLWVVIPNESV